MCISWRYEKSGEANNKLNSRPKKGTYLSLPVLLGYRTFAKLTGTGYLSLDLPIDPIASSGLRKSLQGLCKLMLLQQNLPSTQRNRKSVRPCFVQKQNPSGLLPFYIKVVRRVGSHWIWISVLPYSFQIRQMGERTDRQEHFMTDIPLRRIDLAAAPATRSFHARGHTQLARSYLTGPPTHCLEIWDSHYAMRRKGGVEMLTRRKNLMNAARRGGQFASLSLPYVALSKKQPQDSATCMHFQNIVTATNTDGPATPVSCVWTQGSLFQEGWDGL